MSEAKKQSFLHGAAILAAGVVLLVGPLLYFLLLLLVIRPMRKLSHSGNDYVATLNEGDPGEIFAPFPGKVTNEISDLNDTLYVTQEAIRAYGHRIRESAAYEERINADLALAERIQSAMVPSVPIYAPLFRVRGHMKPAKEVGGDLYNYVMLDDDHVAFFIGDVSGKGVPAALFMAKANTVLQMVLKDFDIDEANRILSKDNTELFFVTAFAAVVEISTGKMRYVNAGHEPVFLYHDGEYAALPEEPNFMFGCIEDFHYAVQETVLSKGDVLFLYTDGISEAMNEAGDLFGKERILEALNSSVGLPCGESFKIVSRAVIRSPGVQIQEAMQYAHNKSLPDEIVVYMANNKKWTRYYQMRLALVQNPKTPISTSITFLSTLRSPDLRIIARSKGIPQQLCRLAKEFAAKRSGG